MKNIKKNKIDKKDDVLGVLLREIFKLEKKMDVGFHDLHNNFNELQKSVDSYAKRADAYFQEMAMLSHQINRHDRWIRQIAEKMGVKLES
ncbi:hypothetical protein HZC33_01710 [Candidatus Wolfebacteria bacterium]|nr:hypothetical protein [Candidatus Wolfebacteria bacterium]